MARPHVLRQIRRFCLDCQGNAATAVKACSDENCSLWPWRCEETTQQRIAQIAVENATALSSDSLALSENEENKTRQIEHSARITTNMAQKALRIIRRHCLACAGHRKDVRVCTAKEECPLWSLRFGVYPATYKRVRERIARGRQRSLFDM